LDFSVNQVTYVVLANLIQSIITLAFLYREILQVKFQFNTVLWKQMMVYASPLILVGMGGVINDTMNRIMLKWWLTGDVAFAESQVGIYNACAKLAILITLFIQAFKMSAEPFFFKQAESNNPQKMYARVMKFFVIILTFAFLGVALYLPIWKYFIGSDYRVGLAIVPILLMANIFLGIYYNLTVWYKLTNKNIYGAWITIFGSFISVVLNYLFIPSYGLVACAWSTLIVYAVMMILSYYYGQKYYPIPYAWKKLLAYLSIVLIIFFIHKGITTLIPNVIFSTILATLLISAYCWFLTIVEQKEFSKLPVVGKYFKG
jgi:O-antigen/teichoic acid export membrane protein